MVEAGLDIAVLHSSQGKPIFQIEMTNWVKTTYPILEVVAGNVVMPRRSLQLDATHYVPVWDPGESASCTRLDGHRQPRCAKSLSLRGILACPLLLMAALEMSGMPYQGPRDGCWGSHDGARKRPPESTSIPVA
jgi:hypothetical protein